MNNTQRTPERTLLGTMTDLLFDLEGIGFGQEEDSIDGSRAVDVINMYLAHMRTAIDKARKEAWAAPELLEALDALLTALAPMRVRISPAIMRDAKQAIAKAKGE